MKLRELLEDIYKGDIPSRFGEIDIKAIQCDSRLVGKGDIFVALKGTSRNGANFISEAVAKGAVVIIQNSHGTQIDENQNVCTITVGDPRKTLLDISQRFYDYPSQKVKAIGITGTNGKTTVSYLIESIFKQAAKRCAVIGTVNYRIGEKSIPSINTTPGLLENQRFLADMVKNHSEYCIMEVSSHALDQGRVDGIDFKSAIFTNLTGDHMDYHRTMDNYFEAKSKLFVHLGPHATAVINRDDPFGDKLTKMTKAKILTYGLENKSDVTARDIHLSLEGSQFLLQFPAGKTMIRSPLIGRHNIYNILAASAACFLEKITLEDIKEGIESLRCVPGRLEQIICNRGFKIFVDYAHTEDALKNVLMNLKDLGHSKIISVFGCGGDRDRTKRPKMGKVASQLADFSILTDDNPRSEDPQAIVNEILPGFERKNYEVILNREEAIKRAISIARRGDIVLVAGKGHEDYQVYKNKTIPFNDRQIIRNYL